MKIKGVSFLATFDCVSRVYLNAHLDVDDVSCCAGLIVGMLSLGPVIDSCMASHRLGRLGQVVTVFTQVNKLRLF